MDAMVSARVPVEVKKQGDEKLKEIGSSITELVNSAYDYLLEHGTLPKATRSEDKSEPRIKTLSGDQARQFKATWANRSILEAHVGNAADFKKTLNEARDEYYARFA